MLCGELRRGASHDVRVCVCVCREEFTGYMNHEVDATELLGINSEPCGRLTPRGKVACCHIVPRFKMFTQEEKK